MLGYAPQRDPSCAAAVITSEGAIGGIGVAMCLSALVIAFSAGYLFTRVILLRVLRKAEEEAEDEADLRAAKRKKPQQPEQPSKAIPSHPS